MKRDQSRRKRNIRFTENPPLLKIKKQRLQHSKPESKWLTSSRLMHVEEKSDCSVERVWEKRSSLWSSFITSRPNMEDTRSSQVWEKEREKETIFGWK